MPASVFDMQGLAYVLRISHAAHRPTPGPLNELN